MIMVLFKRWMLFILLLLILFCSCSAYRPVAIPVSEICSFEEVYLVKSQIKYRLKNITEAETCFMADAYFICHSDTSQKINNLLLYVNKITVIDTYNDYLHINIPKEAIYNCKKLVYDTKFQHHNLITIAVSIGVLVLIIQLLDKNIPS